MRVHRRQREKSVAVERGSEPLGVKDGIGLEHKIDGASEFDGQDGIGLEFVAMHAGLEALEKGSDEGLVAFGDDGGLSEGPAEIGVAEFFAAEGLELAGGGDGAFDEAAIAEEMVDGWETGDVADFIEDGEGEDFTDAGDGLEEGVVSRGMSLGEFF